MGVAESHRGCRRCRRHIDLRIRNEKCSEMNHTDTTYLSDLTWSHYTPSSATDNDQCLKQTKPSPTPLPHHFSTLSSWKTSPDVAMTLLCPRTRSREVLRGVFAELSSTRKSDYDLCQRKFTYLVISSFSKKKLAHCHHFRNCCMKFYPRSTCVGSLSAGTLSTSPAVNQLVLRPICTGMVL